MRVLITGGPKTGKSTMGRELAALSGAHYRSTDELIETKEWSDASAEVAKWIEEPGPWVIEGVAVPRALRKWFAKHGESGSPADRVVWLTTPRVEQTPRQAAMAKACATVWREVLPLLEGAKVPVDG